MHHTSKNAFPAALEEKNLKCCCDGSNALRSIPLLGADALVQPLQEGILEPLCVLLHVRLVAGRDILRLNDTGASTAAAAAQTYILYDHTIHSPTSNGT